VSDIVLADLLRMIPISFFPFSYNNQWMVVDYKKLQSAATPSSGLLVVAEQMP